MTRQRSVFLLAQWLLLSSVAVVAPNAVADAAEVDCNNVVIEEWKNDVKKQHPFQYSSSGLYLSSNRGFQFIWEDVSDMLRYWSRAGSSERLDAWHSAVQSQAFTYVDIYNGHSVQYECLPSAMLHKSDIWSVTPYTETLYLDDKLKFSYAAREAGLEVEGGFIPRTFETQQEAMAALSGNDPKDIFYVKDRFGTKGMGISLHPMSDLPNLELPEWSVIQESVAANEMALYQDRKLTARLYMVIMNGTVYIHHSGTIKVQHATYDPSSTEADHQMSHDGYADPFDLDLHPGNLVPDFHLPFQEKVHTHPDYKDRWGAKFDKPQVPNSRKWLYSFMQMAEQSAPEFLRPLIEYTRSVDPKSYSILGVDVIPMQDGTLQLLEINHFPNFYRFDIMTDIILTMFEMGDVDEELASRLIKVWELPRRPDDDVEDYEEPAPTPSEPETLEARRLRGSQ